MKKVLFLLIMIITLSACSMRTGMVHGKADYKCKSISTSKKSVSHKFTTNKKVFIFPKSHFYVKTNEQIYNIGDTISF